MNSSPLAILFKATISSSNSLVPQITTSLWHSSSFDDLAGRHANSTNSPHVPIHPLISTLGCGAFIHRVMASVLKREQEQKREEEKNRPSREKELSAYTGALFEAWKAGAPSPQSEQRLRTLRQSLYIAPEEHSNMELMVRREYYAQEFRRLWLSEKDVEDGPATIKSLRKRWCINGGESESIEFELLNQLRQPASGPVVLLIDDDEDLLMAMTVLLRDSGFEIRPFTTADAAYDFLLHSTPDIILADINLETSSMGGFAFFERVQQLPRLSSIPFLFVSGLTDEIVIRAGKELGVDDYITKPFDNDELVSAIRGKLRRYAELRRISSN